jgi:anti-sigma factor RsiW
MDCAEFETKVASFLYDLLPESEKLRASAHLDACPRCRGILGTLHTMTCKVVLDLLADFLEGELPVEEALSLRRHLEVCRECVDYLESYQATIQLARKAGAAGVEAPAPVPEALIRAVLAWRKKEG